MNLLIYNFPPSVVRRPQSAVRIHRPLPRFTDSQQKKKPLRSPLISQEVKCGCADCFSFS